MKARKEIHRIAENWRDVLGQLIEEFDADIDLHPGGDLADGYELGHICGKFYDSNDLPIDDELVADLHDVITLYRELEAYMSDYKNLEVTNRNLHVRAHSKRDGDDSRYQREIANVHSLLFTPDVPKPKPILRYKGAGRHGRVMRG